MYVSACLVLMGGLSETPFRPGCDSRWPRRASTVLPNAKDKWIATTIPSLIMIPIQSNRGHRTKLSTQQYSTLCILRIWNNPTEESRVHYTSLNQENNPSGDTCMFLIPILSQYYSSLLHNFSIDSASASPSRKVKVHFLFINDIPLIINLLKRITKPINCLLQYPTVVVAAVRKEGWKEGREKERVVHYLNTDIL